jgi:hypothetical protein
MAEVSSITPHFLCGREGIIYFPVALWPNAGHGLSVFNICGYHTKRPITDSRTPLDELSVRRRDLYLTTHNTHNRQISMSPVGFKPAVPESERWQTYTLEWAVDGLGG